MNRLKPYYLDKGYTDLFVFVGRTIREALNDYEDLFRVHPETFLGYNVLITNADPKPLQGLRVREYYISHNAWDTPESEAVVYLLESSVLVNLPPPREGE